MLNKTKLQYNTICWLSNWAMTEMTINQADPNDH